jgi:hypothetical protein
VAQSFGCLLVDLHAQGEKESRRNSRSPNLLLKLLPKLEHLALQLEEALVLLVPQLLLDVLHGLLGHLLVVLLKVALVVLLELFVLHI